MRNATPPKPRTASYLATMNDLLLAVGFASFLSIHGLRKKSLSPSGALTAFVVGILTMAGALRVFGVALIVFYLLGSRATKYGKQRKAKMEEGYVEAGYRTGWQVLCNSAWAVGAATLWNAIYVPGSIHAAIVRGLSGRVYDGNEWCAVEYGNGWSRGLVFAVLGHFGCCLGDTLASELGILSKGKPRLVTTLKVVPPGTNGGMTVGGTAWSVAGGAVMGLVMGLCLLLENGACGIGVLPGVVAWGAFAGGFGSLVDSVLGATVQRTRYASEKGLVLQDGSAIKGKDIQVISGWDILTNNQSLACLNKIARRGASASLTKPDVFLMVYPDIHPRVPPLLRRSRRQAPHFSSQPQFSPAHHNPQHGRQLQCPGGPFYVLLPLLPSRMTPPTKPCILPPQEHAYLVNPATSAPSVDKRRPKTETRRVSLSGSLTMPRVSKDACLRPRTTALH
ncbi:Protein PGR [Hypsizygus marmoreus]|uniref:Protein PGR n=1 Tax=Hypsizygus marmoreus TaxID=39966 RepID=A0A369JJH2_HYPMA|nr:Protein PGR [Hypsizygus marmoreus]